MVTSTSSFFLPNADVVSLTLEYSVDTGFTCAWSGVAAALLEVLADVLCAGCLAGCAGVLSYVMGAAGAAGSSKSNGCTSPHPQVPTYLGIILPQFGQVHVSERCSRGVTSTSSFFLPNADVVSLTLEYSVDTGFTCAWSGVAAALLEVLEDVLCAGCLAGADGCEGVLSYVIGAAGASGSSKSNGCTSPHPQVPTYFGIILPQFGQVHVSER